MKKSKIFGLIALIIVVIGVIFEAVGVFIAIFAKELKELFLAGFIIGFISVAIAVVLQRIQIKFERKEKESEDDN